MKIKYSELIDQTLYFPQEEFNYDSESLHFHGINLMNVVEQFGTPLKISYLPKISQNIQRAKKWFAEAIDKNDYILLLHEIQPFFFRFGRSSEK